MDFLKIAKYIGLVPASFILYKAIRIYFLRKKYQHIPGPPTQGYENSTNHFTLN
jgi:hypothetical protein